MYSGWEWKIQDIPFKTGSKHCAHAGKRNDFTTYTEATREHFVLIFSLMIHNMW